mmetsp:Transcript_20567/g.55412  ORF Transcript_20567/g.55412 Transcript_20567/m.55412 type:complete len:221 (-) Transcript_20567:1368-2030(-)
MARYMRERAFSHAWPQMRMRSALRASSPSLFAIARAALRSLWCEKRRFMWSCTTLSSASVVICVPLMASGLPWLKSRCTASRMETARILTCRCWAMAEMGWRPTPGTCGPKQRTAFILRTACRMYTPARTSSSTSKGGEGPVGGPGVGRLLRSCDPCTSLLGVGALALACATATAAARASAPAPASHLALRRSGMVPSLSRARSAAGASGCLSPSMWGSR